MAKKKKPSHDIDLDQMRESLYEVAEKKILSGASIVKRKAPINKSKLEAALANDAKRIGAATEVHLRQMRKELHEVQEKIEKSLDILDIILGPEDF